MQPDPDHRTITRQRRQAGRCVRCGVAAGRAALCRVCAVEHSYCPSCEMLQPRADKPSRECLDCQRTRGQHQPRATYARRCAAIRHRKLYAIITRYRAGLTQRAIGEALGMSSNTVAAIIHDARRKGQWPKGLRRKKRHERTT